MGGTLILHKDIKGGFTQIGNAVIRDKKLSMKALGMLCVLFSLPNDWNFSIQGLCAIREEGETSINSTINELKSNGYVTITKIRKEDGKFKYVYNVYDVPQPHLKNPALKNPALENPALENPALENVGQYNTQEYNTQEYNTQEYNKKQKSSVRPASRTNGAYIGSDDDKIEERFERFWNAYPRKIGKGLAHDTFFRIRPSEPLLGKMLIIIKAASMSKEWTEEKGRYIPAPAKWLEEERWEDVFGTSNTSSYEYNGWRNWVDISQHDEV